MRPVGADWKRGYVRGKRSVASVATVGIWMCADHFISPLVPVCVMGLNGRKGKMGFREPHALFPRCLSPVNLMGSCLSPEECCAEVEGAVLMRALCDIWGQMMLIL